MAVAQPELPADVVDALRTEGEDPDAALARLFQEQEHAWFLAIGGDAQPDLQGADEQRSLPSELQSAGSSGSAPEQDEQRAAAHGHSAGSNDATFAFNVQREEYRAHLRGMLDMLNRMAGEQQYEEMAADVEEMSYEELQALGDTIGKVKVGISGTQLSALQRGTFAQLHGCAPGDHDTCAVCQEQVGAEEELTQLPCKHSFHHDCIAQWCDGSKACPVCMTEVDARTSKDAPSSSADIAPAQADADQ